MKRGFVALGCLVPLLAFSGVRAAQKVSEADDLRPVIASVAARGGAVIVKLSDGISGAEIHYTLDGTAPGASSPVWEGPLLVTSRVDLQAVAFDVSGHSSAVVEQKLAPTVTSGALVWAEEFDGPQRQPDAAVWTFETGKANSNHELEVYCGYGSGKEGCDPAQANAFVGQDGFLHLVARSPAANAYTSARMTSQGLLNVQYGRIEARMKLPESRGMWPAFWLLGSDIRRVSWPACGEIDVMEHLNGNNPEPYVGAKGLGYDWVQGSLHFGKPQDHADGGTKFHSAHFSAAEWHTYGAIWKKSEIQFYVDDPTQVYATFRATDPVFAGKLWPFDSGPEFLLLNLAVGGDWPGPPDKTTVFPSEVLVDYVRVYAN